VFSSSVTSLADRAHSAFMELTVSSSSPAESLLLAIRMGQVMKSEYRLTISRSLAGAV
jgi:hypothetical protein